MHKRTEVSPAELTMAYAANDEFDRVNIINEAMTIRRDAILAGIHPREAAARYYAASSRDIARRALETGNFYQLDFGPGGTAPRVPGRFDEYDRTSARYIAREMFVVDLAETNDPSYQIDKLRNMTDEERRKLADKVSKLIITPKRRQERMDAVAEDALADHQQGVAHAQSIIDAPDEDLWLDRYWHPEDNA